jgi:hypothetical protein
MSVSNTLRTKRRERTIHSDRAGPRRCHRGTHTENVNRQVAELKRGFYAEHLASHKAPCLYRGLRNVNWFI